ncbi:MAG: antibiotic biosynthesis monooxygenase [Dehalococcoidia bacterium]|nr:antibiotic biosynthesis monooxygenase [Dehalococcoidia bacterium]
MFIAMNRFRVAADREADFERVWRERESYLSGVPGFVRFALLRGDTPGEYISHSTWQDRAMFLAWTQSEAFAAGHRQGSLAGLLEGPPQVSLYEAVIEQP